MFLYQFCQKIFNNINIESSRRIEEQTRNIQTGTQTMVTNTERSKFEILIKNEEKESSNDGTKKIVIWNVKRWFLKSDIFDVFQCQYTNCRAELYRKDR